MKYWLTILVLILFYSSDFGSSLLGLSSLSLLKNRLREKLRLRLQHRKEQLSNSKFNSELEFTPLKINLPDIPVYYQNWMRYYHYMEQEGNHVSKPKTFFQNNAYFKQKGIKSSSYLNEKDAKGVRKFIPSKADFYVVLYNNTVSIYSDRNDMVSHQIESFNIENISPIPEDKYFLEGVKKLGTFNAGFCLEVFVNNPSSLENNKQSMKEVWIFCLDSEKEQLKFLNLLVKLKIKQQRNNGEVLSEELMKEKIANGNSMSNLMKSHIEERETSISSPQDGYWLLLQDWTGCNLKCGGGLSFQQWQCVPPRHGGKPCKGESLRTQPCNTHPCPNVNTVLQVAKQIEPEVMRPIIISGAFSSRLNRYIKCDIKETDGFLTTFDTDTKMEKKIPMRMVMNNFTLSLYGDDTFENLIHSFVLENTNFIRNKDLCCFSLKDNMKLLKICGFEDSCYPKHKPNILEPKDSPYVKEWETAFKTFKMDCKVGRETTLIDTEDEQKLQEKLRKKLNSVQTSIVRKKREEIKNNMLLDSLPGGKTYKSKMKKAEDVSFKAIEKELTLEKMLKNEEKEKEEAEIMVLMNKIEKEKEKSKCLDQNINEKEIDEMFALEQHEADKEIEQVKADAVKNIKNSRQKLLKKLEDMKNKSKIRKAQLASELNSLRRQMAGNLLRANKIGNSESCTKGKINLEFRVEYCDKNYVDDFIENVDCKNKDEFCNICCENEFGNMHIDKRDNCYNLCDIVKVDKVDESILNSKNTDGKFMWTPT